MAFECPTCGKEIETEQGVKIHHAKVHGENLPNCECGICGKHFYHEKSDRKRCGEHEGQSGELNNSFKNAKEKAECEFCGTPFSYYPSEKPGKFCKECAAKRMWLSEENVIEQYDRPIGPEKYDPTHSVKVITRVDGYEMIDRSFKGGRVAIPHHRLLAIAEYGLDQIAGKVIHHKNGVKWDNRPSNIEPVTRSEHAKIHHG